MVLQPVSNLSDSLIQVILLLFTIFARFGACFSHLLTIMEKLAAFLETASNVLQAKVWKQLIFDCFEIFLTRHS